MDDEHRLASLRLLAHPARLQIVSLLTGAAMSAAEVARELGTTQANASYHLRRLHAAGEIELVEEVRIRGGTARRFRHVPDPPAPTPRGADRSKTSHDQAEQEFFAALAGELQRRAQARRADGRGVNTDAELWVDPDLWAQAVARVTQIAAELHRAARPPRTPGTVRTNTTISMFTMQPRARPVAPGDEGEVPR